MSTTLNDIDLLTQDFIGNYSTGTARTEIRYRAINRAIEYIKRTIGIVSDEKIHSFLFSPDQMFYDLPTDFDEALFLKYESDTINTIHTQWNYYEYPYILQRTGSVHPNRFSVTSINGSKQLIVSGSTQYNNRNLFNFDEVGDWAVADDASDLRQDLFQRYEGTASLSFDISNSAGYATIYADGQTINLTELFDRFGFIKFRQYITSSNITSVSLKLYTDLSNYYTITVTTADDGTAFVANQWQKIGFSTEDAVSTGTPDTDTITRVDIRYTLGGGFTTAADFRVDDMFLTFPEVLELVYISSYKGTDTTGATNKKVLDTATDLLSFSDDYDDIAEIIAQKAALNLWPQLRGDKEQYMILRSEFNENMKTFARRWPRRRLQGQFTHSLRR